MELNLSKRKKKKLRIARVRTASEPRRARVVNVAKLVDPSSNQISNTARRLRQSRKSLRRKLMK